jgi:hypothetical protein
MQPSHSIFRNISCTCEWEQGLFLCEICTTNFPAQDLVTSRNTVGMAVLLNKAVTLPGEASKGYICVT